MPRPSELLAVARSLAVPATGLPTDASLRRAVSTAYYAVFHAILRGGADRFFGASRRGEAGYALMYRTYDHGRMRRGCEDISRPILSAPQKSLFGRPSFDPGLRDVAVCFIRLQVLRHRADYDPRVAFSQSAVTAIVDDAERAIASFAAAPDDERSDLLAPMLGGRG